jgi:hypothetical protein
MRHTLKGLLMLLASATAVAPALGQVNIGIEIPGASIGVYQPVYPELVLIPGYPVYYAPYQQTNYFFYDGQYWVYQDDHWYVSDWYNGPWDFVAPDLVPLFILRIPVRYYRAPPVYFHGWYADAPPRWDVHWGYRWTQHRHGWDHWDRRLVYAPAPLPFYQRQYAGDRYPRAEQRRDLRNRYYHHQSRHASANSPQHRQHRPAVQRAQPHPQSRQSGPPVPLVPRAQRSTRERDSTRSQAPVAAPTATRQNTPRVQQQQQRSPSRHTERRAQQMAGPQIRVQESQARSNPRQSRAAPERHPQAGRERGQGRGSHRAERRQ